MSMPEYIVVGSGCTGAIAAQTLVEAGKHVMMLDVGTIDSTFTKHIPNKDFLTIRATDKNQHRYLIDEQQLGVDWGKVGKGEQITPPRKHIEHKVDELLPTESKTFSAYESLAYGGLGAGWGIGCWQWSDTELQAAGMDPKDMQASYQWVANHVGVSAKRDDAQAYTIGRLKAYLRATAMDRNHQRVHKKYQTHKQFFRRHGFVVGRTPLALITSDVAGRKAYKYNGMDFYSDKDKSAWRPWIMIDRLKKKKNFSYVNNCLVTRFEETKQSVRVHAINTKTNKPVTFVCRKLVLCPGVLGSARVVLRSFNDHKTRLPLLSNPYSYVPCVQPVMLGKAAEKHKLGFAQLSMFLDEMQSNFGAAMASIYSYQSLMLFRLIRQIPLNFADSRRLTQFLSSGLVIAGIHQPDSPATSKYVQLQTSIKAPTKDKLYIHYQSTKHEMSMRQKREKQFIKALRKLGLYALKRIDPGAGAGIHYAGCLPFGTDNKPLTLTPDGKLYGTKRVYVADGCGFTYLPAKGLTFTLMANAHRVAKKILDDERHASMNNNQPTIIITGASGFVGSTLVDHFAQKGWHVRALVRTTPTETKKNVTYFRYDLAKKPSSKIFNGAQYLVHAAYAKFDKKNPDAYKLNVHAAKNLLALSRTHKLKKNIFLSSMSAHTEALSVYGKQKLAIEKLFSSKKDVVLRCGLIVGNGGLVKQTALFIKTKRVAPLISGGQQPLQVIAIYDLVKTIEQSLTNSVSGVLTLATSKVYTYREFYQAIADRLGVRIIFIPVPYIIPLFVIRMVTLLHLPLNVTEDNLLGLKQLRSEENAEDLKKLGVQPDKLTYILKKIDIA